MLDSPPHAPGADLAQSLASRFMPLPSIARRFGETADGKVLEDMVDALYLAFGLGDCRLQCLCICAGGQQF